MGGAAVPRGRVRCSAMETCLYTNRPNDEFLLERKGRIVDRLAVQRPRVQVRAGDRQAARRARARSALAEEVPLSRDHDVVADARPAHVEPADDRGRDRVRLPEHELRGARELVGDRDLRCLELVARRRRGRRVRSSSGVIPATPSATSVVPWRKGRPNESLDDHADVTAVRARADLRGCAAAEASGSSGRSTSVPSPFAFDASTPAEAQTKPCRVSEMISGGRDPDDLDALLQDRLDVARIAIARELERPLGRLDLVQSAPPGPRPSRRPSGRRRGRRRPRARRPARPRPPAARRDRRPPRPPGCPRAR